MTLTLAAAVARFGAEAKAKLDNPSAGGEPEDQLRAPLEHLFADLTELCGLPRAALAAVGESAIVNLKTRPDYAVTVRNALVGFVEVKAPGKGADPRRYKGHDKEQWDKLRSLPNLLYTDGNAFSLWRNGEPARPAVALIGDVETSGKALAAPDALVALFADFIGWEPIPPKTAKELAGVTARLCHLLRDEVAEQMGLGNPAFTTLAADWRKLLFPEANDRTFADGYAQAVTFGLLMARARDIPLAGGLDKVGKQLGKSSSLIGAALRLLTDDAENQAVLKTSLDTLTRVLDAVNWHTISKDRPEAWLYFYEDFLAVYDNDLRKLTGSYYTPPQVVEAMVGLVDDVLRTRFKQSLASPAVTVADPAVGTGTFVLGVLRRIAETVEAGEGEGAVAAAVEAALARLVAFEMQLGPFAVAQLRIHAELLHLTGHVPKAPVRMFVTDTLASPFAETDTLGSSYFGAIAESRKEANKVKRGETITVVIGNPPYKEKAKGRGGWVEEGSHGSEARVAPLDKWLPPADWGVGAHAKHLRNLYVYFWRWATWKVFDQNPEANTGVVCFITVAGFLNGPGFQKMRDYLRRTADAVWVIDCSPDGHQADVPTRVFQGVQQPVCIVLVSRSKAKVADAPAAVRYTALPVGPRENKFVALGRLQLDGPGWQDCPTDWRAPFLPAATGAWAAFPALDDLFAYNGSGVQPTRTWVIAPDSESLVRRWQTLIKAKPDAKENLFQSHFRDGKPADRHIHKVVAKALASYTPRPTPIADERTDCIPPVCYGFRSFDRQWIIPDNRVINQPNPKLWAVASQSQVYLTALSRSAPTSGPAITFTACIPDYDHYKGSFGGRVFPLWRDRGATEPNLPPKLLDFLAKAYQAGVTAGDVLAYLAGVAAHPGYIARFQTDLTQPGLRVPLTADAALFREAADVGRRVVWLHTFGERYADPKAGRPVRRGCRRTAPRASRKAGRSRPTRARCRTT